MKLLGIAGPARSGKDTIGDYILSKKHGYQKYGFAQPMKDMIGTMLCKPQDWLMAHKDKEIISIGASPRKLLQTLGTDWGRDMIHKDLWMMLGVSFINNCRSSGIDGVVITDVRFDNEAEMIRKQGGVICHVTRPNCVQVREHASEAGIKIQPTDFSVNNNGTFTHLYHQVDHLMDLYSSLLRLRR